MIAMADDSCSYCIDTSALIHAWVRAYPPDILPALWKRFEQLITSDVLLSPMDVLLELEKKEGDSLYGWCKERGVMFQEIDTFEDKIKHVMGRYPRLVDTAKGKSGADPMVIALALSHNPRLTVITEEKGGSAQKPKMPYACDQEGLRNINVLQLIRDQKWKF
jgi:Domain of unknown function (DUF4411)